jgi:hypothetical protein
MFTFAVKTDWHQMSCRNGIYWLSFGTDKTPGTQTLCFPRRGFNQKRLNKTTNQALYKQVTFYVRTLAHLLDILAVTLLNIGQHSCGLS